MFKIMMLPSIFLLMGAVVYSSAFLDSLLIVSDYNPNNCSAHDYQCANERCVSSHVRCNGANDCGDFSDEQDCDVYLCKEPKYFRCKNQRCIAKSFVCDQENDCEDFSDEANCTYFKAEHVSLNSTCTKGEWQCTDKLCIPEDWVCNQEVDCLDGSDEGVGCTMFEKECDGFRCNNKRCIPSEWRCDKIDDCKDNSDEIDCEHHFDAKKCTFDQNKYICNDGKACLDLRDVCNGKNDCFDNSDEGGYCNSSHMNCMNHGCSHDCIQLPTGPRCLCPSGYHNVDEKTCVDVNECEVYGICDQKCHNVPGSYKCLCEERYTLQEDKRTCKADGGEAIMIFSSKNQIRSYFITSNLLLPVADDLKQVVGVSSDGRHIYWTEVFSQHEAIIKASEDGSDRKVIVSAGLGMPEDLAIDWLTGNIYFTDAHKHHIGVCNNDGSHCTIINNNDIKNPRAIVLNVNEGTMYWTDWGAPPEIAFSQMDGKNDRPFLQDDIQWANGLALDYPNRRLYWTDAKKMSLESIRLDGTDRRVILQDVVKHPFAISVFENKLYWSDWETMSIDSCDKFTGKNHHTIIKEHKDYIYGINIYHSALQQKKDNPCSVSFCSDICLLTVGGYSCACSEGKELATDQHTCKEVAKKQVVVVAVKNLLVSVEHKTLGKQSVTLLPSVVKNAGAVTYNSRNNSLFISDLQSNRIVELNLHTSISRTLPLQGIGEVTAMDFDPSGNNLYICDKSKATLEIINLNTMSQKVLIHDADEEIPISVALIPSQGVMFVALVKKSGMSGHVDRMFMDGTGRTHVTEDGLSSSISLHFDKQYYRIFFVDSFSGLIKHISVDGDEVHSFKTIQPYPSDLTTLKNDLFWVNDYSEKLFWTDKASGETIQKIDLDITVETGNRMHLTSITSFGKINNGCQLNNGNCSHLCIPSHGTIVCACPSRMYLDIDNKTCNHRIDCDEHEFLCTLSNTCVLSKLRCDGKKDCVMGEDEDDCKKVSSCPIGHFECDNGDCILEKQVCDHHYDCKDNSDENYCHEKDKKNQCPPGRFRCDNGQCIDDRFVCDGLADCSDNSDEMKCKSLSCSDSQFRCDSGACIPKSWECDHEYDCSDFSDEHSECGFVTCAPHLFTCFNGKCVDKNLTCDQIDDCGDNSDEISCFVRLDDPNCTWDQFSCHLNESICLPFSSRCNGSIECPGGQDERNCSNCNADSFECKNKKCIPKVWICDGTDDCGDNSDENDTMCYLKDTKSLPTTELIYKPCEDGFRCKSGACISLNLLCDEKHDCYDESDEGGLCSKSCNSVNNPCSHNCIKTPAGPMCVCKKGFKLMGDGHSCKDINECERNPPMCSQICVNTVGDYFCDCFNGFSLRSDKKSCKATGAPMSLLFVSDNQIRELSQKSNSLRVIYSDEMPKFTAIDVDMNGKNIFFTIENSPTIQKINPITKKRQYIEHIGLPKKIAYDWSTGHIYYYNAQSDEKSISICSFDEMLCTKLIDIDLHRQVSELVIDSVNKLMFYSLTSWWVFNSPNYVLYKANLDGSDTVEILKSTNGYITGLTYDYNKKHLFYADQHDGKIFRISYEGKQQITLFSNLTRLTGLKFFENNLYFSTSKGDITKCQLHDQQNCETFKIHAYDHDLFLLSQEGLQPQLDDPCRNNTCQNLCVASSSSYKCLCVDGSVIDDRQKCLDNQKSSIHDGKSPKFHSVDLEPKEKSGNGSGTAVSVIVISLVIILMAALLVLYAKKKRSGQLNISMKFYNSAYKKQENDSMEKPILTPGRHEYTNPIRDPQRLEEIKDFVLDEQKSNHLVDTS